MGKKKKGSLGSGMIKARFRGRDPREKKDNILHTTTLNDGYDWTKMGSCTEQRDLDDFLSTAQLAGTDFTAERLHVSFVEGVKNEGATTDKRKREIAAAKKDHGHQLRVPRRPAWTRDMSKEELQQNETDSFLEWRRSLASLSDLSAVVVTPFERNLEFWRQLWRVIERSDLVVQIVDARNPLLFRCPDLEAYVGEISKKKNCMLILNKADLLTYEQRKAWAEFFMKVKVDFAFFSAYLEGGTDDKDDTHASGLSERDLGLLGDGGASRDAEGGADSDADQRDADGDATDSLDVSQLKDAVADVLTGANGAPVGVLRTDGTGEAAAAAARAQAGLADHVAAANVVVAQRAMAERALILAATGGGTGGGAATTTAVTAGVQSDEEREARMQKLCYINTSVTLLELFKSKAPTAVDADGEPTPPVIGMVGYPNVGKSSTINALSAVKMVPVSSTPGRTRHFQTIKLGDVTLCDCPGLVFPNFANTKAEMVCNGILPIHQLTDHLGPMTHVCETVSREQLEKAYGIHIIRPSKEDVNPDRIPTAHELIDGYGQARGIMNGRGSADGPRCARIVLKDYVEGAKLRHCAMPPADLASVGSSSIAKGNTLVPETKGYRVAGTHAHNKQYVSEIDEDFFSQAGVRALSTGHATNFQGSRPKALGGKKHFKKGRKEKTRRLKTPGAARNMTGFQVM